GCKTTFKINGWHYPINVPPWPAADRGGAGGRSFEGQAQTAHEKMGMGEASATQPIVPILPSGARAAPASSPLKVFNCLQVAFGDAKGIMFGPGMSLSSTTISTADGDLQVVEAQVHLSEGVGIGITG